MAAAAASGYSACFAAGSASTAAATIVNVNVPGSVPALPVLPPVSNWGLEQFRHQLAKDGINLVKDEGSDVVRMQLFDGMLRTSTFLKNTKNSAKARKFFAYFTLFLTLAITIFVVGGMYTIGTNMQAQHDHRSVIDQSEGSLVMWDMNDDALNKLATYTQVPHPEIDTAVPSLPANATAAMRDSETQALRRRLHLAEQCRLAQLLEYRGTCDAFGLAHALQAAAWIQMSHAIVQELTVQVATMFFVACVVIAAVARGIAAFNNARIVAQLNQVYGSLQEHMRATAHMDVLDVVAFDWFSIFISICGSAIMLVGYAMATRSDTLITPGMILGAVGSIIMLSGQLAYQRTMTAINLQTDKILLIFLRKAQDAGKDVNHLMARRAQTHIMFLPDAKLNVGGGLGEANVVQNGVV